MRRPVRLLLLPACLALLAAPKAARAADRPPVELKDGDRIVLIGDDLIERDQKSGYLETLLTLLNPDKTLTFRNLGWSGDTVFGDARAGFGTRTDGFRHLKDHVLALKPTVLIVGYGMSESFDGERGLPGFQKGFDTLLDALSPTGARLVLLSPIMHEDLGRPLPDPSAHNEDLRRYRDAIRHVAESRGAAFVDLYDAHGVLAGRLPRDRGVPPLLTDDGIHLTELGAWCVDTELALRLTGASLDETAVTVDAEGQSRAVGSRVGEVRTTPRGLRFEATDARLPAPPSPPLRPGGTRISPSRRVLRVEGLAPGRYTLTVDGRAVATAGADEWTSRALAEGPEFDQVERLRRVINEKNLLYFHRWRPQNETYLFGFRKHEQGNNAREIPLFDPLVEAKEKEIARLRAPEAHVYELVREGEAGR